MKWAFFLGLAISCSAMTDMHNDMNMDMVMHGMYGTYPMGRDATGTSWIPSSTQMPAIHQIYHDWFFMIHGFATAIYDHQGGPRGASKFFSENMFMFTAQKDVGRGTFAVRTMISFEPGTIGCNGYPLLLQSGETCNSIEPLIDRQHPHDFLMELAALYTIRFSDKNSLFAYFGYPGEPALGPPAFIHRFSAFFNPEAPITHHWLDSTHIAFGVATLGYVHEWLKVDASIFTGREPDQHRWNFDRPRFDSYAGRISINPTENIAAQISYGFIKSPEQLEPNVNTHRTTASISYNKAWRTSAQTEKFSRVGPRQSPGIEIVEEGGCISSILSPSSTTQSRELSRQPNPREFFSRGTSNWQITAAWGRNHNIPGRVLDGALLESAIDLHDRHVFFGRAEYAAKDELFIPPSPNAGKLFNVGKIDLGYIFEFSLIPYTRWGLGFVGSASFVPKSIKSAYGGTPFSYMTFLRVDLKQS